MTEFLLTLLHGCRSYRETAIERYAGPFSVADGLKPLKNKVLFIGNTFDPITPLEWADAMAKKFGDENASLLVHDARGHTSLAEPDVRLIYSVSSEEAELTLLFWM